MAIDFLILFLLLISLTINLLALGAFWVTPGLRTTANRFVINLLIVNIIGCLILTPTLFLRSSTSYPSTSILTTTNQDIQIEDYTKNHYSYIHENDKIYEKDDIKHNNTITDETIIKCNNNKCKKIHINSHQNGKLQKNDETIVITEMDLTDKILKRSPTLNENENLYLDEEEKKSDNNNNNNNNNNNDNDNDDDDDEINENIIVKSNIPTVIENVDGKNNIKNNRISYINKKFGVNNNLASIPIQDNDIKQNSEGLNKIGDSRSSSSSSSSSSNGVSSSSSGIDDDSSSSRSNSVGILQENQDYLKISNSPQSTSPLNISNILYIQRDIRCWSLDLVAALGALSVLLIVGDTWCAVTDPLRYHSRISGFKAWILIAITWILGIFFGILSALRETTITTTTVQRHYQQHQQNNNSNNNDTYEMTYYIEESIYNLIFSCIYFIIIILLPFGFVCGMYWRIFSEARENGLRMRQNGSSPLLQSAFNLSGHGPHNHHHNSLQHHHRHHQQQQSHLSINHQHNNNNNNNLSNLTLTKDHIQGSTNGGLQMRIDHNIKDGTNKPLLMPPLLQQSEQNSTNIDDVDNKLLHKDRNSNNVVLTLSEAPEDIKRNYSSRHLSRYLGSQDIYDGHRHNGIRQVHSTPNLQKYQRNSDGSIIEIDDEHDILSGTAVHRNALQLPTIIHHTSPKALGYMTSIRHRLSNASSLFKYREESRAARISILVVIMFLVSYLPYGILVILQGRLFQLSDHGTQLSIFVVLLGNISSPFIFAYRNKRVRRGVKRLFNLDPRAKDRQLQRRGIIAHSQGGLIKCTNGTSNNNGSKTTATISVRRNGKKGTTYSINTTLVPQDEYIRSGTYIVDLKGCHYLKNGYTDVPAKNCTDLLIKTSAGVVKPLINGNSVVVPDVDLVDDLIDDDGLSDNSAEHNDNSNSAEKRSILKIVCDSSRKLGCAGGGSNSCASSDCENEPTDV